MTRSALILTPLLTALVCSPASSCLAEDESAKPLLRWEGGQKWQVTCQTKEKDGTGSATTVVKGLLTVGTPQVGAAFPGTFKIESYSSKSSDGGAMVFAKGKWQTLKMPKNVPQKIAKLGLDWSRDWARGSRTEDVEIGPFGFRDRGAAIKETAGAGGGISSSTHLVLAILDGRFPTLIGPIVEGREDKVKIPLKLIVGSSARDNMATLTGKWKTKGKTATYEEKGKRTKAPKGGSAFDWKGTWDYSRKTTISLETGSLLLVKESYKYKQKGKGKRAGKVTRTIKLKRL